MNHNTLSFLVFTLGPSKQDGDLDVAILELFYLLVHFVVN